MKVTIGSARAEYLKGAGAWKVKMTDRNMRATATGNRKATATEEGEEK